MFKKNSLVATVAAIAVLGASSIGTVYAAGSEKPVDPKYPSLWKTSEDRMAWQYELTPEFKAAIDKLPKDFLEQFKNMTKKHDRFSNEATARQVMHEILSDVQCVIAGISIENAEMTADCAVRASAHRWPRGHLLAYVQLNQINVESLGALPQINKMVEVGLENVGELALKKDFIAAGEAMGGVLKGCATCHAMFRFDPGTSKYIKGDKPLPAQPNKK